MTPVHITKRALAKVGKRPVPDINSGRNSCDGTVNGYAVGWCDCGCMRYIPAQDVTCPACLILLDAEFEGRGAEAARRRAEIEAGR